MNTSFQISASEFNKNLFERIQSFIKKGVDAEIIISITEKQPDGFITNEINEEYIEYLNKSVDDINAGKGITFTMQELKEFIDK